ncbi:MAG: hypothetical protein ACK46Y_09360 [Fluviicola sp.]
MNKLLTICFITLSFVSFTQSKKKQNELLKTELESLKKEQEQLYTEKTILNSEIATCSKRLKGFQVEYINLSPIYLEREYKIGHLFKVSEQLKLDANVASNGEFPDVNGIKLLITEFKEHEKNNKLTYLDATVIDESFKQKKLSVKSENIIYKNLIDKLKLDIYNLKMNIEVFEKALNEREAILSKIEAEMTTLKNDLNSKAWLIDYLEKEVTKAEQNFRMNGPKGFSKEYFQVFPEAFPDYTSEGVKKPTPKKPKTKSNEFIVPVVTDKEPEKTIYDRVMIVGEPNEAASSTSNEGDFGYFGSEPEIVQEPTTPPAQEAYIYDVVDETAQFPGGQEALKKYIKDNLKYPQTAIDMGIE